MTARIQILLLALVCGAVSAEKPRFANGLLSIFKPRCVSCHSGANPQAGLDLASAERILKGGRSGSAILIGEAARILLVEKIVSKSMDPADPKLTEVELQALRAWIDKGGPLELAAAGSVHAPAFTKPDDSLIVKRVAAGEMAPPKPLFTNSVRPAMDAELQMLPKRISAGASPDSPQVAAAGDSDVNVKEKDRQFWSFQPPKRLKVPSVRDISCVRNPIDSFLLQKLEEKNLSFSTEWDSARVGREILT